MLQEELRVVSQLVITTFQDKNLIRKHWVLGTSGVEPSVARDTNRSNKDLTSEWRDRTPKAHQVSQQGTEETEETV